MQQKCAVMHMVLTFQRLHFSYEFRKAGQEQSTYFQWKISTMCLNFKNICNFSLN